MIIYYFIIFINFFSEETFMKILVINAGSSSLKYQLIDMEN